VGRIAPLGVILIGKGVKKAKEAIGEQNNIKEPECSTTNRSLH